MKLTRVSVVSAMCSAFLMTAAPAQAAPSPAPSVNVAAVVDSVLRLLQPPGDPGTQTPASSPSEDLERELKRLLQVESTAYCLTGTMASGKPVYEGAAAMNGVPLGSKYRVVDGPEAGKIYTIEDRIGHSSEFDIAFPGDCEAAMQYGRRTINIAPVR